MTPEEHLIGLGKLVANLQSLEMFLRLFLAGDSKENVIFPSAGDTLVPETFLTNFDSLGELVRKYNKALTGSEFSQYSLEPSIVQTRDMLAHGRLSGETPQLFPLTLWKFGRSDKAGNIRVEQSVTLSSDWFDSQRQSALDGINRVIQCGKSREYKSFRWEGAPDEGKSA
jgi:hypothetical protein